MIRTCGTAVSAVEEQVAMCNAMLDLSRNLSWIVKSGFCPIKPQRTFVPPTKMEDSLQ
jgi:hypothetical protein